MDKMNVNITKAALDVIQKLEQDSAFSSQLKNAQSINEIKALFESKDLIVTDNYAQTVLNNFKTSENNDDLSVETLENVAGGRAWYENWAINMVYVVKGAATGGVSGALKGFAEGMYVACSTELKGQSIWNYWGIVK